MAEDRLAIGGFTPTPANTFKKQGNRDAEKYKRDITRARAEGHAEGRSEARSQAVDFLHKKYMDPSVERGTPEAQAILKVSKELVAFLTGKDITNR